MKKSNLAITLLPLLGLFGTPAMAQNETSLAAKATNSLGLDLISKVAKENENTLISPYSIQLALAMTFAGAEGKTREEMSKVLHYPDIDSSIHSSFSTLNKKLLSVQENSEKEVKRNQEWGIKGEALRINIANRLYGEKSYEFKEAFLTLLKDTYNAPFQPVDFLHKASLVIKEINCWVENETNEKIKDLLPPRSLSEETRLVLVNAIYLKAPWAEPFKENQTDKKDFYVREDLKKSVSTMINKDKYGYQKKDGYSLIAVPYNGGDLQFLIILPDKISGLNDLQKRLTPEILESGKDMTFEDIKLFLPKFKLEPPLFSLSSVLQSLGMKEAFDKPQGSADFSGMAERNPNDYLYISEVFHKTFISVDEKGTEAAAATAVAMFAKSAFDPHPKKPLEVHVDHPFMFAIQDKKSGACLFLGKVTDPE